MSKFDRRADQMSKAFLIAVLLVAMSLAGCVYPPAKDMRTGADLLGPVAIGTIRQPVLGGCRNTFMYSGTCDLIFTDLHGRRVDGHRVARELDQTAKQIAPLAELVGRLRERGSVFPYELHLLTITPAVVLAVPTSAPRTVCGSVYDGGCIQVGGLPYWYRTDPPIRQGSFWYVANGERHHPIDAKSGRVQIAIDGTVVDLVADGAGWVVRRAK
jgi:hypothetical protein